MYIYIMIMIHVYWLSGSCIHCTQIYIMYIIYLNVLKQGCYLGEVKVVGLQACKVRLNDASFLREVKVRGETNDVFYLREVKVRGETNDASFLREVKVRGETKDIPYLSEMKVRGLGVRLVLSLSEVLE